jgi:hypothetical protein
MCHSEADRACRTVLDNFPEIPFIPVLPKASYLNGILNPAEGMPCLMVDEGKGWIYFDTSHQLEVEIASFYDQLSNGDLEAFRITPQSNPGFYYMLNYLKSNYPPHLQAIRFDIMGPVTFMLKNVDENHKPIFYNETLRDAIAKSLAMKVRWQEQKLHETFPKVQTMLNIAEPMMGMFGSAFFNVKREDILVVLREVIQAVSGLSCIHCCANTDWALLLESGANSINFDAYEHTERLALYPKEIKSFLEKGGILEWGIVPISAHKLLNEDPANLLIRLENSMESLVRQGIDKKLLVERAIITPSCATVSMTVSMAEKVYAYTKIVAQSMRYRYFK